jgi:hypothetical protein
MNVEANRSEWRKELAKISGEANISDWGEELTGENG